MKTLAGCVIVECFKRGGGPNGRDRGLSPPTRRIVRVGNRAADHANREFSVQRFMLRSKIHRATLTGTDLNYEGSIAVDNDLLRAADILPGEQVHVLNLNNGERLITYAIEAPAGSKTVLLNGPAARLGMAGDLVVIISYCTVPDEQAREFRPIIVLVDENNRIAK